MRPSEIMMLNAYANNKNNYLLLSQKSDLQHFVLFLLLFSLNGELSGFFSLDELPQPSSLLLTT
jgi:hypothetical protein